MKPTIKYLIFSFLCLFIVACEKNQLPDADFTADPTTITQGGSIQFTDQSTGGPTSWTWMFGDGQSSAEQHPSHTYNNPGLYTVTLVASNGDGSNTKTKSDYISVNRNPTPPVANFEGVPRELSEGGTVEFNDLSTNNPTNWSWNFGDGGTSTSSDPSYQYNTEGIYTVSLTVTNDDGSDTETKTNYITVNHVPTPLDADFTANPTTITQGESVQFTDQSTGDPTSWIWMFGDGQSSSEQHPSHTYSDPGFYSVTLTASNAYGSNAITKLDYIIVEECMGCETGYVYDVIGNTYNTVRIGNQWWMAENLATTSYNDGSPIPIVIADDAWVALTTPAYSWYENDEPTYGDTYGALYNWYAVDNGNLCPSGWHVPSDDDWKELELFLGLDPALYENEGWRGADEGDKLKATSGWVSNGNGTNETGFTALPGGYRDGYNRGAFALQGSYGQFWATDSWDVWGRTRYLGYDVTQIGRTAFRLNTGQSVRCIKD